MYYDNKSTFYIKQYGPAVIVSVISIVLIASGVFIYLKSSDIGNPFKNKTEVTQLVDTNSATANKEETNALVSETKVEEVVVKNTEPANVENVKYFENLVASEKSKDVTVTNISASGSVTVEVDGDKLEVALIGIDFKYSKESAIEKMKTDLLNQQVKIVFDTLRSDSDRTYAYIFKDNSLYNATLLKTGLVTLKTERTNKELNNELSKAQTYARENSLGVWKK
ncbi:MAG: thermonuclease family protein [Clostridia bacterium]|nr:thermonuclease family protein [Clostridia bacterium]